MGNNMLHNYEPLKLGNITINKFKTFVVCAAQRKHKTPGVLKPLA